MRHHDIVTDPLPEQCFDLIPCRLLLEQLPAPETTLRRLAQALKPGGWLVVEASDFASAVVAAEVDDAVSTLFRRWLATHARLLSAAYGGDPYCGRRLRRWLWRLDLVDIDVEGRSLAWQGGTPGAAVWRHTIADLGGVLVAGELFTPEELAQMLAALDDPSFIRLSPLLVVRAGGALSHEARLAMILERGGGNWPRDSAGNGHRRDQTAPRSPLCDYYQLWIVRIRPAPAATRIPTPLPDC